MAMVRWSAFTCVGWQVTLYDPLWHVTSNSSEMWFPPFTFTFNSNSDLVWNGVDRV